MKNRFLITVPGLALILLVSGLKAGPNVSAVNPYLAASHWPMAHGNAGQQNVTRSKTPMGPGKTLKPEEIKYVHTGPFQLAAGISAPYKNGRRVIWNSGVDRVVKLDYNSFQKISEYKLPGKREFTRQFAEYWIHKANIDTGWISVWNAYRVAVKVVKDLSSVYTMIDSRNEFYVGGGREIIVYGDGVTGKPDSPIVVRRRFRLPASIGGVIVGINMTYDGHVVIATTLGHVMVLSRDFSKSYSIKMKHSENADPDEIGLYAWVRNSFCLDERGGIYIVSHKHMHRVVWTGKSLSIQEADGAWTALYSNGQGRGSGSTPSLMGSGKGDKFVVITDGDELMNLTLFWRESVPNDWKTLPGASSRRIAGFLPVNFGDASRTQVQSEQTVVVGGYGAFVVNNEPRKFNWLPTMARLAIIGALNGRKEYQPFGAQKFEWDSRARKLKVAWSNQRVSSPNAVPFVNVRDGIAYTVGARDNQWTIEGLDWKTGESRVTYLVGDSRYNSSFALLVPDMDGRLLWGTTWGMARISP